MDGITHLVRAADAYGLALEIERSTVSWRLFGDGKKLAALVEGADIQVRRFEGAMRWLSANWPEGAVWPDGVPRPEVDDIAHAASVAPGADAGAGKNDRNIPRTAEVSA